MKADLTVIGKLVYYHFPYLSQSQYIWSSDRRIKDSSISHIQNLYNIPTPDTSPKYMYTIGNVYITFKHLKRYRNLCRSGYYKIATEHLAQPKYMYTIGHVKITFNHFKRCRNLCRSD
jgi:hypothetical protein